MKKQHINLIKFAAIVAAITLSVLIIFHYGFIGLFVIAITIGVLAAVVNGLTKIATDEQKKVAQWYANRFGGFWAVVLVRMLRGGEFFIKATELYENKILFDCKAVETYAELENLQKSGVLETISTMVQVYKQNLACYLAKEMGKGNSSVSMKDALKVLFEMGPEDFCEAYPSPVKMGQASKKK